MKYNKNKNGNAFGSDALFARPFYGRYAYMSSMKGFIFLVIALLSNPISAFDYESYSSRSFREVIEHHEKDFDAKIDIGISAIPFKYKANVIFSKKLRKISRGRLEFIKKWAKSLGQTDNFINSYQHEFLIIENGFEIWLPMQEQVLPFMGKELIEGKEFEIYFFFAGIDHGHLFFLGTEFKVK